MLLELLLIAAGAGSHQEPGSELGLQDLASPAGPRSSLSNLVRGADGSVVLSWVDLEPDDVAVMRIAFLGESGWSEPAEVVRGEDLFLNWADFPAVAVLESGTLVAQWLRQGAEPHGYSAEFSISTDRGAHWSPPRRLHSDDSAAEHGFVSLVPIDASTFGALWLDGRAAAGKPHGEGETGLWFRTIDAKGELGDELVLDPRVCDCCQTGAVALPTGGLVALYRDRSVDEVRDISFVRFDAEARRWSDPRPVHVDGWTIAGCPVNGPRIAADGDALAAAWYSGVGEGGGCVRIAFAPATTGSFGEPIDVDAGRPIGRADVVLRADGSAVVTWLESLGEGRAEWRALLVWRDGRTGKSLPIDRVSSGRPAGSLRMITRGADEILTWTATEGGGGVRTARLRSRALPEPR